MAVLQLREADQIRIRFEAMLYQVGEKGARTVMRRALNHQGRKGFTRFKRALRNQTSIKAGRINKSTRFRAARNSKLEIAYIGWGNALSLKEFNAKQFSFGVRAKVWGKTQRFTSAFIYAGTPRSGKEVANGHVFKRVSSRSLPIEMMYGPSIPKEMLKGEAFEAFESVQPDIMNRALHELAFLLNRV